MEDDGETSCRLDALSQQNNNTVHVNRTYSPFKVRLRGWGSADPYVEVGVRQQVRGTVHSAIQQRITSLRKSFSKS